MNLNFSSKSLTRLEMWVLENFTLENIVSTLNKVKLDVLARYVGETFRKKLDAKGVIKLDDLDFAFYGMPIIVDKEKGDTIISPYSMMIASLDRQTGNFIETVFHNFQIKRN